MKQFGCGRLQVRQTCELDETIHRHRAEKLVVPFGAAVRESDFLAPDIHGNDLAPIAYLLLRQSPSALAPDSACAAVSRETECVVGAPGDIVFAVEDVVQHPLQIRHGYALA